MEFSKVIKLYIHQQIFFCNVKINTGTQYGSVVWQNANQNGVYSIAWFVTAGSHYVTYGWGYVFRLQAYRSTSGNTSRTTTFQTSRTTTYNTGTPTTTYLQYHLTQPLTTTFSTSLSHTTTTYNTSRSTTTTYQTVNTTTTTSNQYTLPLLHIRLVELQRFKLVSQLQQYVSNY